MRSAISEIRRPPLWRPLLLMVALLLGGQAWAEVEYVEVRTQGRAASLPVAINSALLEALARVNGKALAGDTSMLSVEASEVTSESESYYASEAFARSIQERTEGAVSDYRLLDQHRDADGLWVVEVSARIAKFQRAAAAERLAIAVVPLRVERGNFAVAGARVGAERVRSAVGRGIADFLTQTRKFAVLDRDYADATDGERRLIQAGETPVEDMARLGQTLAADYVLAGTLSHFDYTVVEHVTKASGRRYTTASGRAEVGFRVIDTATRQIAVSDTVNVRLSDDGLSADQAISRLSRRLGQALAERIQTRIYPLMVVAISNGELVVGQGGDTLSTGEVYKLYEYGDKTYDPYTKEYLGRTERYVGTVRVNRVTPKTAYASVVDANEDVLAGFETRKYILRGKVAAPKPQPAREVRQTRDQHRERLRNDDDW
ncbi:CsgG/HfaB family protein [Alcanivorax sp. MM125-6]|nr:CsgG/HfaB family protein [Alcanivorax sp. MM125-6]